MRGPYLPVASRSARIFLVGCILRKWANTPRVPRIAEPDSRNPLGPHSSFLEVLVPGIRSRHADSVFGIACPESPSRDLVPASARAICPQGACLPRLSPDLARAPRSQGACPRRLVSGHRPRAPRPPADLVLEGPRENLATVTVMTHRAQHGHGPVRRRRGRRRQQPARLPGTPQPTPGPVGPSASSVWGRRRGRRTRWRACQGQRAGPLQQSRRPGAAAYGTAPCFALTRFPDQGGDWTGRTWSVPPGQKLVDPGPCRRAERPAPGHGAGQSRPA